MFDKVLVKASRQRLQLQNRAQVLRILTLFVFAVLLGSLCICSTYSLSSMRDGNLSEAVILASQRSSRDIWIDEWMLERNTTNTNSTFRLQIDESFNYNFAKHLLFPDAPNAEPSQQLNRNDVDGIDVGTNRSFKEGSALFVPAEACSLRIFNGDDKKHFREMRKSYHLDARFGKNSAAKPPLQEERLEILRNLFKAWTAFADDRHIPYNIAHGLLLGWTWGQKIMPWDDDLDVQVPSEYLNVLLSLSNQTFNDRYFLDVNPHFQETSLRKQNLIDARFIDKETGYFMDITGLYMADYRDSRGRVMIRDKNWHKYRLIDYFPLIRTKFEGIETWVPYNVQRYLKEEYGMQGTKASFTFKKKRHRFDKDARRWVKY